MSVKTGIPGPWLQPSEYSRNEIGQFATVPYEDVDPNKINNLAAQFDRLGYRYRVIHSFGKHRLEVYLSYNPETKDEQPVDLWEYTNQSVSKDLLSVAYLPSGITRFLIPPNVQLIRQALNGVLPFTPQAFDPTKDDPTTFVPRNDLVPSDFIGVPEVQQASYVIYLLMKTGYDSLLVTAPIIRHTQTVSSIYPITLSKQNVGRIITTPSLISMENPPDWAVTGLPDDIPTSVNNIALGTGWYKFAPTIQQIAGQKVAIVQEFQYGAYPFATMGVDGKFI
jgi:hypothetical protein